jgi:hypothetical protein
MSESKVLQNEKVSDCCLTLKDHIDNDDEDVYFTLTNTLAWIS